MNSSKVIDKYNSKIYISIFLILNLLYIGLNTYKLNLSNYYLNNNLDLKEYFINTRKLTNGILFLDSTILIFFVVNLIIFFNPIVKYKEFFKANCLLVIGCIVISTLIYYFTDLWILNFLQQLFIPTSLLIVSTIIKLLKNPVIILLKRQQK